VVGAASDAALDAAPGPSADATPGALAATTADASSVRPASRELRQGLAITLTNPKPLLFFGAFFAMFITPAATSRITSFYALGALFELINVTYFATLLWLVTRLRSTASFERWAAGRFNRVCGAILVVYAAVVLMVAVV
jgi:leucine efflux protein